MDVLIYTGTDLPMEELSELVRCHGFPQEKILLCQTKEELSAHLRRMEEERELLPYPFPIKGGIQMLNLRRVAAFHGEKHRVVAIMADGQRVTSRSVRTRTDEVLAPALESGLFQQVSRACFVNLAHIGSTAGHSLRLNCGDMIPVTRNYTAQFQLALRNYGQEG